MEKLIFYDFWIAHFIAGVLYTMAFCSMMGSLAGFVGEKILIHQKRPPLGTFKYELIDSLIWTLLFAFLFLAITWKNPEGSYLRQMKFVLAIENSKIIEELINSRVIMSIFFSAMLAAAGMLMVDIITKENNRSFLLHELAVCHGCVFTIILNYTSQFQSCLLLVLVVIGWLGIACKHKKLVTYPSEDKKENK